LTPEVDRAPFRLVAITSRSGLDESFHYGAVVGLGAGGSVEFSVGDPSVVIYPRSSNKPLQATAMVRVGLDLPGDLLALVCASHNGEERHVDGVRAILARAELDASALQNTPDLPLDADAAAMLLRSGLEPQPLFMNCSGKHAGMLATCQANGWPSDASYLDPDHPLQRAITATIAELTEETATTIGVDGCGAPAHAFSLLGLARGFRAVALGVPAVRDAMTSHPDMVGGRSRDVTHFMQRVPGLMAKDGAEGVFAAALPDGRTVALKIADGASRARSVVMAAALARLGVDAGDEMQWRTPIFGHGRPVGDVRAAPAVMACDD
jgi:L-asparaginase II